MNDHILKQVNSLFFYKCNNGMKKTQGGLKMLNIAVKNEIIA